MEKAFAKINLVLQVFPKTNEPLHKIFSIASKISLCDEVSVKCNNDKKINIVCDNKEVPCDESNTVYKALVSLNKYLKTEQGYDVEIKKNIPLQAGLGGGSSDAAAAIKEACNVLGLSYQNMTLANIAQNVGSDVPQFFYNQTVIIKDTGSAVYEIPNNLEDYIVLVKPNFGVSAKEAYEAYDKTGIGERIDDSIIDDLAANDFNSAIKKMKNDLEKPVMAKYPELKELKLEMLNEGLDFVMMSGSGSTFFGLTKDISLALSIVEKFKKKGYFSTLVEKVY